VVLSEPTAGYETIDPGSYALISVHDSGRGIAPHDISRLFEPFFSSKRLNDHSGSGLGLSIVHGVVKEHGGFVNVQSTVDCGTTFTLYLPRTADVQPRSMRLSYAPHGSAKVLVVDDEPVQLRTCQRVLSHLGYQVDTMSTGHAAYERFLSAAAVGATYANAPSASPYDLVILDMLLNEEEDGLQLFNRIRALFPLQKGIVASGHAPSELVGRAAQNGLAWLAKPYTKATLAQAVHAALNHAVRNSVRVGPPLSRR
jgi:CheY-like chemotaxis protein